MRVPWTALLPSPAASISAPQGALRAPARGTSFGRELAAALKQGTSVPSDRQESGATFESAALAITMPLPDQATALPGSKHDLDPPRRIERDVFVRVIAGRLGAQTRLPPTSPTPLQSADSSQSKAKGSSEFTVVNHESAVPPVSDGAQTRQAPPSSGLVVPAPEIAPRAPSTAPPLAVHGAVVGRPIEASRADASDQKQRHQLLKPHDRPLPDSNQEELRSVVQVSTRDGATAVVQAGIDVTTAQPVAGSASNTAATRGVSSLSTPSPDAARGASASVRSDADVATLQTVIDTSVKRSITGEASASDTRHRTSANWLPTRDLDHALDGAQQDQSATVVRALEPAGRWPAPRASGAEAPAAAEQRVVNQALDAASEIAIDGLAQRRIMQPPRWSMLLDTRQPHAGNAPVDSGTQQEPARDASPRGQDHAAPPTVRDAAAPAARFGTSGSFATALQPPAAESVSSAAVSQVAVAANASQTAAAPSAVAPLRVDATPAAVPALVEQVVQRLLAAPANGTVTLRLDPPELGTLLVRFQRRGSQLSITMTAEREDVSRLLRQGLGPLQSSLSQLHEQVSVQVDTHAESRARGDEAALGSRRQREPDARQNEPTHDQDTAPPAGTPAQRAKRGIRNARLDVWS